ncbi:MAG: hypothetical protein ACJ8F4_08375 [Sphingomonas sp.]
MSKLSLSRAWEETTSLLARDGRLFVAVALALFVLPGLVLNVSMPEAQPGEFPSAGPWIAVAVIAALVSLVGQLAVIRLAMEPHVAVGEAISHALKRILAYIVAVLIWLVPIMIVGSTLYKFLEVNQDRAPVGVAIALLVLSFVGMFLAVRLMLSSAVASAENAGPFAILRRSWELSKGNWWRLFCFLILFGIGAIVLLWAIESVVGLLVRMAFDVSGPLTVGNLLIAIVSQLVSAVLSVIFFVLLARIYVQRSGGSVQASVPSSGA